MVFALECVFTISRDQAKTAEKANAQVAHERFEAGFKAFV